MARFIKKRWVIIILAIVIACSVVYYFIHKSQTVTLVKTYKVKRETLKDTISLSGTINAEEKTTLRFQTSGRLAWVGVKKGDYVEKYQAVASLDQRDVKNRMQKYLNTYMDTRWTFDQTKDDKEETKIGGLSKDAREAALRVLDQAQFDLNNAVLDVELQNLSLEYANLISPIEGIVTKVGAPHAGINITPAQSEIEIVNPKTIYFAATADQTDVVKLNQSLKGEILLDSYPENTIQGKITAVDFVPKEGESGTVYEVRISFNENNNMNKYRLGMTGDVTFTIKERPNILAVPSGYIHSEDGKKYVWIQRNGNKTKQYVTIGDETDSDTEITSGLSEGAVIYD